MTNSTRQAGEAFMYAYECVDDGRWQAYQKQLKRHDGTICPGLPLIPASDLDKVSRERDEAVRRGEEMADLLALATTPDRFGEAGTGDVYLRMVAAERRFRAFLNTMDNRDGGENV